jgi:hypothetical protein
MTEMGDGTAVLLNLDTKFYFTLNSTGVFIWKLLASGDAFALETIADHVTRNFDVDEATARADVQALVSTLYEEKLLIAGDG